VKFLIWFIALFSLAVGLTLFAEFNSGYALIFLPPWRVEISLNIFIVLLLASVIALYLGLRMFAELSGLPERVKQYRARQQERASVQLEREARIAFNVQNDSPVKPSKQALPAMLMTLLPPTACLERALHMRCATMTNAIAISTSCKRA
jgi:hypothetical protein